MTQAKIASGDLNNFGGFFGGNDGTMVFEAGPAGAKVNAITIDTAGKVAMPLNNPGSAPIFSHRAWACGTTVTEASPTIGGSGNIASITRTGVGSWAVLFTVAMPSANYAVLPSNSQSSIVSRATSKTASGFTFQSENVSPSVVAYDILAGNTFDFAVIC